MASDTPDSARGADPIPGERAGDVIDRYELIEEIGEGGMGTVWMAEQHEPIRRRVALKVIKLGMDTREVVLRFEAERQALALMDHPHIAKVHDGGATAGGRPYFVMELVDGVPITEFCDRETLGVRARLELFIEVCGAIQHAHQKGIIHRDVKPSNVLVSLQGADRVPKVIDFGIAKAAGVQLTEKTLVTRQAQMIGTPDYMAPEQAEMAGLDIDTRADVYSLGVLLYELLTGTTPFDMREALAEGFQHLMRLIHDVDPSKPSTRISALGDKATPLAASRHASVDVLRRRLRGDLDWIVMKALEKDRARRYETASGLAADVQRFLDEEPVVAAPPSAMYRLKKFVRRRTKTVAAVAAIAFLLVAGSIGTGVGWWQAVRANAALDVALVEKGRALDEEARQRAIASENAERARENADRARENAEQARASQEEAKAEAERATEAEAVARARAAELQQVADFQAAQLSAIEPERMGMGMRDRLVEAIPEPMRDSVQSGIAGVDFTSFALRTLEDNVFNRAIEAIDTEFDGQPVLQAQLLQTVATTLRLVGLFDTASGPQSRALALFREQLGDDSPLTVSSLNQLGALLEKQGRYSEAEPVQRDALERHRRLFGDDDPRTLTAINNLGSTLRSQGRLADAEQLYRLAIGGARRVLGGDDIETLTMLGNLGRLLLGQNRLAKAEPFLVESLEGFRRVRGDDHPDTLTAISSIGFLYTRLNRPEPAEVFFRQSLEGFQRVLGEEHSSSMRGLVNLGGFLKSVGRHDEAEGYLREALELTRRVLGDEHPLTWDAMNNLGDVLISTGALDEAEPLLLAAVEHRGRTLGEQHPSTLNARNNLAGVLYGRGKLREAAELLRPTLEGCRRVFGPSHPNTLRVQSSLEAIAIELGEDRESSP